MKLYYIIFAAFLPLLIGCSATVEDCICTMEFRIITVKIVDQNNNPVTLDSSNVSDTRTGKFYIFSHDIHPGSEGIYAVMSDQYVQDISVLGNEILFKGFLGSKTIESNYIIATDECKCHVYKKSGPDTLFVNL